MCCVGAISLDFVLEPTRRNFNYQVIIYFCSFPGLNVDPLGFISLRRMERVICILGDLVLTDPRDYLSPLVSRFGPLQNVFHGLI